jgi:hypothetical protein
MFRIFNGMKIAIPVAEIRVRTIGPAKWLLRLVIIIKARLRLSPSKSNGRALESLDRLKNKRKSAI